MKFLLTPLLLAPFLAGCKEDKASSSPADPPSLTLEETQGFSGNNAYVHCAALCAMGPRPSNSPAYVKQISYLSRMLEKAGWTAAKNNFSLSDGTRMTNLHAVFGKAPASAPRPILISCHIDTKQGIPNFIGADDGASAAAVMLELARILASRPDQAALVEFAFFDGEESFAARMTEEDGLFGSRYDVLRRGNDLPRCQINLDMVGARHKTIAIPVWDTDPEMLEHYAATIEELGLSEQRWTFHHGSYMDDHRPFAQAGVATLNLICRFQQGGWWHTEKDDMSRIDPASLQETGEVVLHLISRLCPSPSCAPTQTP